MLYPVHMKQELLGIREASRLLGLRPQSLYLRMKKYGIKPRVRYIKTVGLSTDDVKALK